MENSKGRSIRKIQLVNAPNNPGAGAAGSQGCFPHLGLINLGTIVQQNYSEIEIEILDGSICSLEEIIKNLGGDLIGISALTTTYESALMLAQKAKELNSIVVLGNDHASRFAQTILRNRPYVDAVFIGDHTEFPFLKFVQYLHEGKGELKDIESLCFREEDSIRENASKIYSKEDLPLPNRTLVDHSPYIKNFNNKFEGIHGYKGTNTSMNIASGCIKRNSRCVYCDIYSLDLFTLSSMRTWREIISLQEEGFDWIWEVCDDFSTFAIGKRNEPSYLERLVQSKPLGDTPRLYVYSRAQEIKPRVVELYKSLNIAKVNIGMDSGDDLMLKSLNKSNPQGNEDNLRAAQLLDDAGIHIHVSYVLGAVGETEESLDNTYQLAKELIKIGNVTSMDPSVLLPLPGAPVWRMLYDYDYAKKEAEKYGVKVNDLSHFESCLNTDRIDTKKLAREWVDTFCKVDYSTIEHYAQEINKAIYEAGGVPGDFGVPNFDSKKLVRGKDNGKY